MKRLVLPIVLVGILTTVATSAQNTAARIDAAFEKFWTAGSPDEAARFAQEVLKTGVTFDDAFTRLKAGRRYTPQVSGIIKLMNRTRDGVEHHFAVNVPENYNPSRKYQVRFQLHGGVDGRTDNQPRGSGAIGQLAGAEQIYVLPYSWRDAPWWSDDQILNLNAIVDQLKRTYNIDENRVVVAGVSDGGTGAYYVAMRETTPFASFLPLNGFILVLANNDIDDGRNYPNNLRNKPFFVINGGRDRLYPTSAVEPFTRHLMSAGVTIEYHPQPEGEHNTAWWPQEKDGFEKFVTDHPRNPYPDTLTWTTSDATHNRAHWLVIDEFGQRASSTRGLPNVNQAPGGVLLFENEKPAGRVDISRKENTFDALTEGVASFTILLSPDRVDFSRPVKVVVNGRTVFDSRVQRNIETLLKWTSRDNDRTMLFGAELSIRVP